MYSIEGSFRYFPIDNLDCCLRQVITASEQESGHRVFILPKDPKVPAEFSESIQKKVDYLFRRKEDCRPVLIQKSEPNNTFLDINNDPKVIIMPDSCYVEILTFFKKKYATVCGQILKDLKNLETIKGDYLQISSSLYFKGPGLVEYRHYLGKASNSFYLVVTNTSEEKKFRVTLENKDSYFGSDFFDLSVYAFALLSSDLDTLCSVLNYK